jgi:hypothetical protein
VSDSTASNSETLRNLQYHTLLKLSWFNIRDNIPEPVCFFVFYVLDL